MNQRVKVGTVADFSEKPTPVDVDGISILITRVGDKLCAVRNNCPHWNVSLSNGKVEDGAIICPLHNSRFDLCSGENLDWVPGVAGFKLPDWTRRMIAMGKDPQGLTPYQIEVIDDEVIVVYAGATAE